MQTDDSARRADLLADTDRARLRPGVDAAALERFLAAIPGPTRRVVTLSFMRDPTMDELRDAAGLSADDFAASSPALSRAASAQRGQDDFAMMVDPNADPALHRLWRAIEPAEPSAPRDPRA